MDSKSSLAERFAKRPKLVTAIVFAVGTIFGWGANDQFGQAPAPQAPALPAVRYDSEQRSIVLQAATDAEADMIVRLANKATDHWHGPVYVYHPPDRADTLVRIRLADLPNRPEAPSP